MVVKIENLALVSKPVKESGSKDGVAEQVTPLVKRLVGGSKKEAMDGEQAIVKKIKEKSERLDDQDNSNKIK